MTHTYIFRVGRQKHVEFVTEVHIDRSTLVEVDLVPSSATLVHACRDLAVWIPFKMFHPSGAIIKTNMVHVSIYWRSKKKMKGWQQQQQQSSRRQQASSTLHNATSAGILHSHKPRTKLFASTNVDRVCIIRCKSKLQAEKCVLLGGWWEGSTFRRRSERVLVCMDAVGCLDPREPTCAGLVLLVVTSAYHGAKRAAMFT